MTVKIESLTERLEDYLIKDEKNSSVQSEAKKIAQEILLALKNTDPAAR